jgi:hypothetical protein
MSKHTYQAFLFITVFTYIKFVNIDINNAFKNINLTDLFP